MSIANEIQRLQRAKADIKAAIEQKGVTVGDGTIDTYAKKIGQISSSGGGDAPTGYWERYVVVGNQIGPSEFDYPETKEIVTIINNIYRTSDYTMPGGETVYSADYGEERIVGYLYKEVYKG